MNRLNEDLMTDSELIKAIVQDKSEIAFRSLYHRFSDRLYKTIFRLLKADRDGSSDVLQMTWIRAVKHLNRFAGKSSLSTWLTGIAINCCSEYRRQFRYNEEISDKLTVSDSKTDDLQLDVIDLNDAISRLAEGHQQIVIMHDLEGYTHEQIAKQLGITTGTSKSQLYHGRKKLVELLSERQIQKK